MLKSAILCLCMSIEIALSPINTDGVLTKANINNYLKTNENAEDILLLAQLVQAEAGNQNMTGKRLVADVVLNRIESSTFPDTIKDVIYQDRQFSVVKSGTFQRMENNISFESLLAAEEEYKNERLNNDIVYFRTTKYSKYGTPAFKYGNHFFSRE